MSIALTPPPPRRILVRGVNWLGDAVMTTPALLRLREKFPHAHITLLCAEKIRPLFDHHPAINETLSFQPDEGIFAIAKKLRGWGETSSSQNQFDLALVLPNSPRSALEVFAAGIPQRLGYARPWRNLFLTQTVATRVGAVKMHKRTEAEIQKLVAQVPETRNQKPEIPQSAHQVHEYLHLVAALGANPEPLAPQLLVTPAEVEAARGKFGLEKILQPIFGLNPGAEYGRAKRWPVEKFIAAAQAIQAQTNCYWLILGGKNDLELTGRIAAEIGNRKSEIGNVSGQTSLRELMALLKCCRLLLTNDTGPMHVAAALGTPVIVPFGSTSPELTGPGMPGDTKHKLLKSDAPCSPCFLRECPIDFRCMNRISVEQVVKVVLASLG